MLSNRISNTLMDPTSLISHTPIPEIWQFPLVGIPPNPNINGRDSSIAESTVTDQSGGSRGRRRQPDCAQPSEDESSMPCSCNDALAESEAKRFKAVKSRDENDDSKAEAEESSGLCKTSADQNTRLSETPKQDFIHVRARRGQATDSHSLAERARREKISERMKILQDLVPGCNKVIGKASVLDEIINYIQALQCQVEFLSVKLEAVNSRINPAIEAFPPKDFIGTQAYDTPSLAFGSQTQRDYEQGSTTEWLHMQVGGAFERVT